MKSIETLVDDIKGLFASPQEISPAEVDGFARNVADVVRDRLSNERRAPYLRLSNLGSICKRKLWYEINTPELGEPLPPEAKIKFLFGDILEAFLFFLASIAGHKVSDQQKEVSLEGIKGHIDGKIDDFLVDAKSASSYSFNKFEQGLTKGEDAFGYLTQIDAYMEAEGVDEGAFLVIDKTLGKITLDRHKKKKRDYPRVIADTKEMLSQNTPPSRSFSDIPEGKSGNMKLGLECSYCAYKKTCFPSVRAFAYSRGPVFLTKVLREPDVPEIPLT